MNRLENWRKIWERKGKENMKEKITLKNLIAADGFDTPTGRMTEETWMKVVEVVKRELNPKKGNSLLEVGCGAGAMLLPLSQIGIKVAGVDYSSSLIELAKKTIPDLVAYVGEACKIPFKNNQFNAVLSYSVFFYFPDYEYAERTLLEMKRVCKEEGRILIMDIPDLSKKEASERYRRGALSEEEYSLKYTGLSHLYYDKKWFDDFANKNELSIRLFDQNIEGYDNSPFRFNITLWRKK